MCNTVTVEQWSVWILQDLCSPQFSSTFTSPGSGALQNFPVSILGLHDALGLRGSPPHTNTSWLDTWPKSGLLEKSIPSFSGWIREGR